MKIPSKKQKPASMNNDRSSIFLPEEIWVDILLRLHIKPLFRCKCVSRELNSIVSDLEFGHQYMQGVNSGAKSSSSSQRLWGILPSHTKPEITNGESSPIATLATALLASLTEIITTVATIDREQNFFLEFGCFLYRVTPAITELKSIEYYPPNAIETIQSLYNNIQIAKEILSNKKVTARELGVTLKQLEGVIKLVGEDQETG